MKRKNLEEKKVAKVTYFTTEAQKEKFQKWCAAHGITMSEWLRDTIEALK